MVVLPASATPAPPDIGVLCTAPTGGGPTTPEYDLQATEGYIYTPDGNSLYMWSYALDGDGFQFPGPVLCVDEGDTVTVNLTNNLPGSSDYASIVFPGQTGVSHNDGTPGLFTGEADPGGTVEYTFTAEEPGTYLYESGTEPHKQIEMGLYGALIVRPSLGAAFAYNDPDSEFDPDREYLLLISEIDPDLHAAVEDGLAFDITTRHTRYWFVNGRSFPDSIADNNAPWLPNQPYGALVVVTPDEAPPALIRYANAGMDNHPFHPHGNHLRTIARDGRLLRGPGDEDASMENFTKTIGAGQTYDLLFGWSNLEDWAPTPSSAQIPVGVPGLQNLVFKDDYTWYGGSPYLGYQDDLPVGTTTNNECGEFYFPWHSHALNEFQNFDEGFGGLATLLRVDPSGGC
jgi:FtsP/CotA-like multicopper oxidase with cupredoxin domain